MKILIIASSPENDIDYIKKIYEDNQPYVICADGGIDKAESLNIPVDLHIGDFDSGISSGSCDVIRHPCEKDWTDTEACIYKAIELGADGWRQCAVVVGCPDQWRTAGLPGRGL